MQSAGGGLSGVVMDLVVVRVDAIDAHRDSRTWLVGDITMRERAARVMHNAVNDLPRGHASTMPPNAVRTVAL